MGGIAENRAESLRVIPHPGIKVARSFQVMSQAIHVGMGFAQVEPFCEVQLRRQGCCPPLCIELTLDAAMQYLRTILFHCAGGGPHWPWPHVR
jgi:hypothetical protein